MIDLEPTYTVLQATTEESDYIRDRIVDFNIQQVPISDSIQSKNKKTCTTRLKVSAKINHNFYEVGSL